MPRATARAVWYAVDDSILDTAYAVKLFEGPADDAFTLDVPSGFCGLLSAMDLLSGCDLLIGDKFMTHTCTRDGLWGPYGTGYRV